MYSLILHVCPVRAEPGNVYLTSYTLVKNLGGTVAQSVERVTSGEEVPDVIPAVAARSLLVGSLSV